jgi:hypothetical protein
LIAGETQSKGRRGKMEAGMQVLVNVWTFAGPSEESVLFSKSNFRVPVSFPHFKCSVVTCVLRLQN